MRNSILTVLSATLALPALAFAAEPDFLRDVQPVFEERCYVCHGDKLQQGDFRLDLRGRAFRGGGSGVAAIVPGDSENSLLYRYVAGIDDKTRMPPTEPYLGAEQVELIKRWIDAGAEWPEDPSAQAIEEEPSKFERAREHWAFQPRKKHSPPVLKDRGLASSVRNPIDAFVWAELEQRGWQPSPPAEPHQLLRRVHLDLTGLLPNLDEQESFLRDPTPEALDRVIEDLLARGTYGERWARHWLDLVRYAETNGYERDATL